MPPMENPKIRQFQVVQADQTYKTAYDIWALDEDGQLWRTTIQSGHDQALAWSHVKGPVTSAQ
jgi:hypothetical protein